MATLPKTLTYREWQEMPGASDATQEVVNGEVRIMLPDRTTHVDVTENLPGLLTRRDPLACRVPDPAVFKVLRPEESTLRTTVILREGSLRPQHFSEVEVQVASIWPD